MYTIWQSINSNHSTLKYVHIIQIVGTTCFKAKDLFRRFSVTAVFLRFTFCNAVNFLSTTFIALLLALIHVLHVRCARVTDHISVQKCFHTSVYTFSIKNYLLFSDFCFPYSTPLCGVLNPAAR